MTPADLQDAKPQPWKGEKAKDPTPAELRLKRAGLDYGTADHAFRAYVLQHGANGTPDYAHVLKRWQDAGAELLAAGREMAGEPPE
jgi:hypothetical protein